MHAAERIFRNYSLALVAVLLFGLVSISCSNENSETKATRTAQSGTSQKVSQEKNEGPVAPDFALENLQGESVKLSDYKGKVVFVNFWATWCGPCRQEIPHFIELIDKYGEDGFVVLGIALDPREFDRVPGFVDNIGINYPVLLDSKGVSNMYGGIRSIPTTFVVARDGIVVERIVGSRPKDVFEEIIKRQL